MAEKSVAEKARVKPGAAIACINEEPAVVSMVGLPEPYSRVEIGEAEIVLLFVRDREELHSLMPVAMRGLAPTAALWVFFRRPCDSGLAPRRSSEGAGNRHGRCHTL